MNLTLTTKKAPHELVQLLKSTPRKQQQKINALRYLGSKEMEQHMGGIYDRLFRKLATERERNACLEITKGFAYTIPYVDIYLDLLTLLHHHFSQAVEEAYGEVWGLAPQEWRNHIVKGAKNYIQKATRASSELRVFVNKQAGHLNALSDEQAERVMDLESTEIEVKLSTDLGYYIEPGPKEDKYLMSPKEVSRYLIQQSKGMIYDDAIEISRKLRQGNFPQSQYSRAFFVRIK
jgi:hypothetical protein